jgi:hypothetical protein
MCVCVCRQLSVYVCVCLSVCLSVRAFVNVSVHVCALFFNCSSQDGPALETRSYVAIHCLFLFCDDSQGAEEAAAQFKVREQRLVDSAKERIAAMQEQVTRGRVVGDVCFCLVACVVALMVVVNVAIILVCSNQACTMSVCAWQLTAVEAEKDDVVGQTKAYVAKIREASDAKSKQLIQLVMNRVYVLVDRRVSKAADVPPMTVRSVVKTTIKEVTKMALEAPDKLDDDDEEDERPDPSFSVTTDPIPTPVVARHAEPTSEDTVGNLSSAPVVVDTVVADTVMSSSTTAAVDGMVASSSVHDEPVTQTALVSEVAAAAAIPAVSTDQDVQTQAAPEPSADADVASGASAAAADPAVGAAADTADTADTAAATGPTNPESDSIVDAGTAASPSSPLVPPPRNKSKKGNKK